MQFRPRKWQITLALFVFLFFACNPWTYYKWASWRDTVSAYEGVVLSFPSNKRAPDALARIRVLKAEAANRLANERWPAIASTRSASELQSFLAQFQGTDRARDAEARLTLLHNDPKWVYELATIDGYKRFLRQNPGHAARAVIEKKIIDLEVAAIAASDHAELPKAQRTFVSEGAASVIQVYNGTSYELTVLYSGPDSQRLVIPSERARSINLPPGQYKVAASVSAASVRNYYGTETFSGGSYPVSFYIESEGRSSRPFSSGFRIGK